MTAKQFYDWQTSGGTDDVMRLVDCLERADIAWCAIGGVAVNHWAQEPMVTQDVDFVVAADAIEQDRLALGRLPASEPSDSSGRSILRPLEGRHPTQHRGLLPRLSRAGRAGRRSRHSACESPRWRIRCGAR